MMGKVLSCAVDESTFKQVIRLAESRGIVHQNSGTANASEMLRQLIEAGLCVMGDDMAKPIVTGGER
jgi:hypothetical protein